MNLRLHGRRVHWSRLLGPAQSSAWRAPKDIAHDALARSTINLIFFGYLDDAMIVAYTTVAKDVEDALVAVWNKHMMSK